MRLVFDQVVEVNCSSAVHTACTSRSSAPGCTWITSTAHAAIWLRLPLVKHIHTFLEELPSVGAATASYTWYVDGQARCITDGSAMERLPSIVPQENAWSHRLRTIPAT